MILFYRSLILALGLSLSSALTASADERAVTVFAASPAALKDLSSRIPPQAEKSLREMLDGMAGPLAQVVQPDQALGFWLDWRGELPLPIVFIQHPNMDALHQALTTAEVAHRELDQGIHELTLGAKLYYREVAEWLFIATTQDDLKSLGNPTQAFQQSSSPHALQVHLNMQRIPAVARTEVAKILAIRLLPPEIALAEKNSAEGMIKLYATRCLKEIATFAERLQISLDPQEQGLVLEIDVEGTNLQGHAGQSGLFPLPPVSMCESVASIHVNLHADEKATLTWWSQSLIGQLESSLKEAPIAERRGEATLFEVTQVVSNAITQLAQQGQLEGFAGLVGKSQDVPLVGIRLHESIEAPLLKWLNNGALAEFGIRLADTAPQMVGKVKIYHLSVDDENDSSLCIVGISENELYVTYGMTGLRALTDYLNSADRDAALMPLGLRLQNASLPTLFGSVVDQSMSGEKLSITSGYTPRGMRFTVQSSR